MQVDRLDRSDLLGSQLLQRRFLLPRQFETMVVKPLVHLDGGNTPGERPQRSPVFSARRSLHAYRMWKLCLGGRLRGGNRRLRDDTGGYAQTFSQGSSL